MGKLRQYWLDFFANEEENETCWWTRKKALCKKRGVNIVKISGKGHVFHRTHHQVETSYKYLLHLQFLIKQKEHFYIEECVLPYQWNMNNHKLLRKKDELWKDLPQEDGISFQQIHGSDERFTYDRRAAVQYAERWWNSYNPQYRKFTVDCTNYVSQCLRAGGAPMWGAPNRERGWWYQHDNWSFSWAVAHSLRWYLSGATEGVKGVEVDSPKQLSPGDVICYDFSGDGRWEHNTFVVTKDANGMPLVNAHTNNSRHRYWSYEDSAAWTPNIKYKFFQIKET